MTHLLQRRLSWIVLFTGLLPLSLPPTVSADTLPACPAPQTIAEYIGDPVPFSTVFLDRGNAGAFSKSVTKGLARTPACANMNYVRPLKLISDPIPTSADRAIAAIVSPSTIYRTDSFTDVTFDILGAGVPSPFIASFPSCMPVSANGSCNISGTSPQIAVRVADDYGNFTGPWSVIQPWKASPVQFDRLGECKSTAPHGISQEPSPGPPCTYRVTFLRNPNSANEFVLSKRTQLLVATVWQGGITLGEGGQGTNYEGTDYTVFSMVLDSGQPPPNGGGDVNANLRGQISELLALIKSVKVRVPKAKKGEQDSITAQAKSKSAELLKLVSEQAAEVRTTSSKVKVETLGRKINSAIGKVLKRRAKSFADDRRKATASLKALLKGLAP